MSLASIPEIERYLERAQQSLDASGAAWVVGAVGTGRSTFARQLAGQIPDSHLIELPSVDLDAGLHGLVQVASAFDSESKKSSLLADERTIDTRSRELAEGAREAERTLVVLLPHSWLETSGSQANEHKLEAFERARMFLRGLLEARGLRLVLLTDIRSHDLNHLWAERSQAIDLPPAEIHWESLEDPETWGPFIHSAREVQLGFRGWRPISPVVLRLAIGLRTLGVPLKEIQVRLQGGPWPQILPGIIVRALKDQTDSSNRLIPALKLAAVRLSLTKEEILRVVDSAEGSEEAIFLTECLAFGDENLLMTESLRLRLLSDVGSQEVDLDGVHLRAASAYAARDGALSPELCQGQTGRNWMERIYQLSQAGPDAQGDWEEAVRPLSEVPRELVWERARRLSRSRRYGEAAGLYAKLLDRPGPGLDYTREYYWYNREKDPADPVTGREVIEGYRSAVEPSPDNPWWNSRLMTCLIDRARFEEARSEWSVVLQRLSVHCSSEEREIRLLRHIFSWVASAWLNRGFPLDAFSVLQASVVGRHAEGDRYSAPRIAIEMLEKGIHLGLHRRILTLLHSLADALEVQALGESVYPCDYPVSLRWKRPEWLAQQVEPGRPLISWHPGRVVESRRNSTRIVFATTDVADPYRDARVLRKDLPAADWELATQVPHTEAAGYFIFAVYEGGLIRGRSLVGSSHPWRPLVHAF